MTILISVSCVNATQTNASDSKLLILKNNTNEILNENINDFSSLNDEINAASQTKLINLSKDYSYSNENDKDYCDGIAVNIDDLVIDGQGHTINANNHARIFNINSKNVTLKNLVVINGKADSHGGAILWSGTDGKVINCIFKNSVSPNSGGAIYFKNAATIENTTFNNNTAYFGGAVDFEQYSTVNNCKFENNFATYLGGAVFSSDKINCLNSTFTLNEAGDGGAIYFFREGLVENTLFQNNIAIGYGGAITNEFEVTVKNSRFIKNTGAYAGAIFLKGDGNILNSTFNENSAKTGGAISSYCDNAYILNCEFNYNKANKGKTLEIINKKIKLENLTFTNNVSSYELEIYIECNNKTMTNLSFNNVSKAVEPQKVTIPQKTTSTVKKVVKKKTAITAKTKMFKLKKKTKKYTIKLKSGKTLLKNKKIKLKVNGRTYTAKTNKKGQATFKLKISKKGKFKAVIRFYGDKLYKASKKTVYIKIKK